MSKILNIGGDQNDASYRYKMPALVTKVEGKGNGIKTVIVNMVDVSKALHTDPAYTTRYFGYELGAQSTYKVDKERAVVNGQHQAADLQKVLARFIEAFILCPKCGLPEIKMKVKSSGIKIDCAACGHNGNIATTHKLTQHIIKDHKEKKGKKKEKGKDKDKDKDKKKKDKKKDKDKKKSKDEEEGEGDEGDEEEEEKEDKKKKDKSKDQDGAEDDDVWHTDISKEAQEARKQAEFAEMMAQGDKKKTLEDIMNAGGEGSRDLPAVVLKVFLAEKERTINEIVSECRRLQLARGLDEPQKVKVLLEAVIDTNDVKNIAKSYSTNAKLISKLITDKRGAQILIGCIEEQVGIVAPLLMPRVPLILQALYEEDVLSEEVLLAWHASPPESSWLSNNEVATKVRARATPFIEWLKNAEDESDDEE